MTKIDIKEHADIYGETLVWQKQGGEYAFYLVKDNHPDEVYPTIQFKISGYINDKTADIIAASYWLLHDARLVASDCERYLNKEISDSADNVIGGFLGVLSTSIDKALGNYTYKGAIPIVRT